MSTVLLPNQLANGRLQVRIAWGADLTAAPGTWSWTDVTTDVVQANGGGISISVGRANGASVAQPASCAFRLKNQTGAYSPANPAAANYPNVRLGTPVQVRVSLDGGSTWTVRFQGEAASWVPGWDAQGRFAYVALAASGLTRRLGQGSKPLKSALTRWHLSKNALALWPLDDDSGAVAAGGATNAASPLFGSSTAVSFGQASTLGGASAAVSLPTGESVSGNVQGTSATGFLSFDLWVLMFTTAATNTQTYIATISATGGIRACQLVAINDTPGPAGFQFVLTDSTGGLWTVDSGIGSPGSSVNPYAGGWHNVFVTLTTSGSDTNVVLYVDGSQADSRTVTGFTFGSLTGAALNNTPSLGTTGTVTFAELALNTTAGTTNSHSTGTGYTGEAADTRVTRLCGEEDVSVSVTGTSGMTMGAQTADTFLNLLRGPEATDLGYLLDGLGPGLTYICHSSIYNESAQLTVDANSGQVPVDPGPSPALDDQRLKNRVTATSPGGSSVTVEATTGPLIPAAIGAFENQVTANPETVRQLGNIAGWLVHVGTTEGMRYPQVVLDLTAAPELASAWLGVIPTDRIDVTNLSNRLTQHPSGTVSLLAEGWAEFLSSRAWKATVNCSPFRPLEVFTIADARLGRIETDGSTLNSSATSGTTSLSVASSGRVWDTAATPFDIEIEGEQITVTAITGSTSPQTFTVTRSVNGVVKAHNSAVTVKLWRPGVLAL